MLRHIRVLPRSGPSSGVALRKTLVPPEIVELKQGQIALAVLILEFASTSNRDGDLVARLDIRSSTTGGSSPVEVKPSLADLLRPYETLNQASFDKSMSTLQGFGRVTSKVSVPASLVQSLPRLLLKHAALTLVSNENNQVRLVGQLPASDDLVMVVCSCDPHCGKGTLIVCCDHAVAVNSLSNALQRAIASAT